jgi:WD40 repeat protein
MASLLVAFCSFIHTSIRTVDLAPIAWPGNRLHEYLDTHGISATKTAQQEKEMRSTGTTISAESRHNIDTAILSPDGHFQAVAGKSNTVVVLDAVTKEPWVTYYGHQAGIYRRVAGSIKALAWLPDGNCIVSGSTDGSIHIWHARTGIHRRTLTQPQKGCAVLALTLSNYGCLTALRGKDVNTWQLC